MHQMSGKKAPIGEQLHSHLGNEGNDRAEDDRVPDVATTSFSARRRTAAIDSSIWLSKVMRKDDISSVSPGPP